MRKTTLICSLILCLALPAILIGLNSQIRRVYAQNTVYIRADGRIEPVTAPISTLDNVTYTVIGNINESIVIERSDIIFDGAGHLVDGSGAGRGLYASNVEDVTIKKIRIEGFYYGIELALCSRITVVESNVTANGYDGILVDQSSESYISLNKVSSNGNDGLKLLNSSSNNVITENTITLNNDDGIQLSDSPQNTISDNTISQNSDVGIYALNSSTTTVIGNTVTNNRNGLEMTSSHSNEVDDNTFNSNGLYGISLSTSPDSILERNTMNNNYDGIYAYQSPRNAFLQNEIQGNDQYGIWLDFSSNNTLSSNNITGNSQTGIYLRYSSDTAVSDNLESNSNSGLSFSGSSNCLVLRNMFVNNNNGIAFAFSSTNNQVYQNNFVNNTQQATSTTAVTWESGLEGNFWSDYSGSDQNLDGIGDAPYVIDGANDDDLPLLGIFHSFDALLGHHVNVISNSTVENFSYARLPGDISITMHVSNRTSSQTVGLCRITIPHSLMTEPYNVTVNDAQPNYANHTIYDNGTHRWIYFDYDHSNLEIIIHGIETEPPEISVISPENVTYATSDIPLDFAVNEPTSWIGYSLDAQANVTIGGNTTLSSLSEGLHDIVMFANDTFGNMGASATVYFSVDTLPPIIQILSPENATYHTNSVALTFSTGEPVSWMGYSLNGQANATIAGNTTLLGLSDGSYSIIVYANDSVGNMGSSDIVYFTVAKAPTIVVLSPQNMTYSSADVTLTFRIDETASWIGYSLDGLANVTIAGNTTLLGLSDGAHSVLVYANDTSGNMGSSNKVFFSVDTTLPQITLLSPLNQTYQAGSIALTFTVNKPTSWVGYSLNGQPNATIAGNTTLLGLSDGAYSIVVYANTTDGKMGVSEIVYFTIARPPEITIVSPQNLTYAASDVPLTFTVNETTSWMGYSLDGLANVTITGNTTLSSLSDGNHNIIVYANDAFGNTGSSTLVSFSVDTAPPDITSVSQNPPEDSVQPYDVVNVNATVVDDFGVNRVFLNYTTNNGTWFSVDMSPLVGNIWHATIPGFTYGTRVNYTIVAEDNVGNSVTSDGLGYVYQVVPEFSPYMALLLLMTASLIVSALHRRKRIKA